MARKSMAIVMGLVNSERYMDRTFEDSFGRPSRSARAKVKAAFKSGIREIRMPRTGDAKAKEVKVKSSRAFVGRA